MNTAHVLLWALRILMNHVMLCSRKKPNSFPIQIIWVFRLLDNNYPVQVLSVFSIYIYIYMYITTHKRTALMMFK